MSIKVVSAVGDKTLERLIGNIDSVDVLTRVRKRERVIDTVISYNPHAVVLSRELTGKGDLLEIVQRLRIACADCRVVFIYGNKDPELRQAKEFLQQQGVRSILVGTIDQELLQDAIERDQATPADDLISAPETDDWTPMPAVAPTMVPTPAGAEEKAEELLLNEKMQQLLDQEPSAADSAASPQRIAVAALQRRGGATHLSLEVAAVLARQHHKVGVQVEQQILDAVCRAYGVPALSGTVTVSGVTLFCSQSQQNRFDVVVQDMGQLSGNGYIAFFQAPYRLLCCGTAPWDTPELLDFIEENSDVAGTVEYILYPAAPRRALELTAELRRSGCRAYPFDCNPEPFAISRRNEKVIRRMLQSLRRQKPD